tara:strand:+ start:154 stop:408 length:255 start_codon:yes stop_codon:yes gene_type:complete
MIEVDPKLYNLNSRVSLKKRGCDVFIVIDRKTRIIMKDGHRILEIAKQVKRFEAGIKVSLLSNAPVCSKTQKFLSQYNISIKSL